MELSKNVGKRFQKYYSFEGMQIRFYRTSMSNANEESPKLQVKKRLPVIPLTIRLVFPIPFESQQKNAVFRLSSGMKRTGWNRIAQIVIDIVVCWTCDWEKQVVFFALFRCIVVIYLLLRRHRWSLQYFRWPLSRVLLRLFPNSPKFWWK